MCASPIYLRVDFDGHVRVLGVDYRDPHLGARRAQARIRAEAKKLVDVSRAMLRIATRRADTSKLGDLGMSQAL